MTIPKICKDCVKNKSCKLKPRPILSCAEKEKKG